MSVSFYKRLSSTTLEYRNWQYKQSSQLLRCHLIRPCVSSLQSVPYKASEHGNDDHDDDDSKDNSPGAPHSQITALHFSPHPHCLYHHNFISSTSTPQLTSQAQTVHGCVDRNSTRCRNLFKALITELKLSGGKIFRFDKITKCRMSIRERDRLYCSAFFQ